MKWIFLGIGVVVGGVIGAAAVCLCSDRCAEPCCKGI